MSEEQEESKPEQGAEAGEHPADKPPVKDDMRVVTEAVQFPVLRANPIRWIIALIVVAGVIAGLRFIQGTARFTPGKAVSTDEGLSYTAGDIVSQPFEAEGALKLNLDDERYIELSPGASVRLESTSRGESAHLTLKSGRVRYTGPPMVQKVLVDTSVADVGISGGRAFIELWGGEGNERLRVGVLNGSASITAGKNRALSLGEGDAVFVGQDLQPQYLVTPLNEWPGIDPRLDKWVFPMLTRKENPTVAEFIEDIGNQVGLRVLIPNGAQFANLSAGDISSYGKVRRACALLDELALQWGFEMGLDGDVLMITPLDEPHHLAAIGEWVLFTQAKPANLFWPKLFSEGIVSGAQYRFDNIALLSAAPYEQRLGALAILIANRLKGGGEYTAKLVDAELAIAFDVSQPYILRRLAFEDLYANPDIMPEKIVPQLEVAKVETAREYFRLRVWGPPAWGDPGVWSVYEGALAEKSKDDESKVGFLYQGMYAGELDYRTVAECMGQIWPSTDINAAREVTRYFYDLSIDTPKGVDPVFISVGLKSVFNTGRANMLLLAFDALRTLSKRLEPDNAILWLIDPYTTDANMELSQYAAAAMGTFLMDHPFSDQRRQADSIKKWIVEISDPISKQGYSSLFLLGLIKGLDTEPCFVDEGLLKAVETRLGKIPSDSPERLGLLRLIRVQRQALEGSGGLAWAYGIAASKIIEILSDKDAGIVLEAILSLGLDEPSSSNPSSEPEGLRAALDDAFISLAGHQDPRLRWLSLNYLLLNKPQNGGAALEKLAGDEYPAIAKKAKGEI
jgi:hypothetical protein